MVAIVSGNTLGLNLTSLATLGQRGVTGSAGHGRNGELAYVNVANGNLVLQDRDDLLLSRGADLSAIRTYNSQGQLTDDNADNWSHGIFLQQLRLVGTRNGAGSTLVRTDRDGSQATYTYDTTSGRYTTTAGSGAHDTIAFDTASGQYEWTDGGTGTRERYEAASGRLLSLTDTSGNALTYGYDASGKLASMTGASGETTYLDYSGNNLTQVRTVTAGPNGPQTLTRTRYVYDASNRLSTVVVDLSPEDNAVADGRTYVTQYTYDGTSTRIASVTQSDGTSLAFTYVLVGGTYRVETVRDALGQLTSFAYDTTTRRTTVTDPLQLRTLYDHDATGQLERVTAPAVGGVPQVTSFAYNANGDLTRVTDPAGRTVDMAYDARGNQTLQRDGAGNTVTRTYDSRNQLLTETAYIVPDADGDGAGQPALPLTTRYVYDAAGRNQLRFIISPEGRVTEHRYDAFGNRVATLTFGGEAFGVQGLAATQVPPEINMAYWSSLQAGETTQRTDFTYDFRGQLAESRAYEHWENVGRDMSSAKGLLTRYVYDPAGLLLGAVSPDGGITTLTYDGLGRLLSSTDALNKTTINRYDDANRRTAVTMANGLFTTSTYDAAGRLVSVMQSSAATANLGETKYFYDADGRLLMTRDATGVARWSTYDEAGRKVADIDADGTLTEYVYHANNLLAATVVRATAVPTGLLLDAATGQPRNPALSAIRPPDAAADQRTWRLYDAANRLVQVVDAQGGVTSTEYDGASRVIAQRRHAQAVTVPALGAAPMTTPFTIASHPADRVSRTFYSDDGLVLGELDAENYYTQYRHDAAGRRVAQTRFASPMVGTLADGRTPPIVVREGAPLPASGAYVVQRAEAGPVNGVAPSSGGGATGTFAASALLARLEAFKAVDELGAFRDLVALVRHATPTLKAAGFDAASLLRNWVNALATNSPTRAALGSMNVVIAGSSPISGTSTDTVYLGDGAGNNVYGDAGNDFIDGGLGNDNLTGGEGDDTLDGGLGNDWMLGSGGADTYMFGWGSGQDIMNNYASSSPGPSPDTLLLGAGVAPSNVSVTRSGSNLILGLIGSTDTMTILSYFTEDANTSWNVGTIRFANGAIWTVEDVKARALAATAGNDRLEGYGSSDLLAGGAGNDTLSGAGGADALRGGDGRDSLSGGDGNDTLTGGSGRDSLDGDQGADVLEGGSGADVIHGGNGDDTLNGGTGNDYLYGDNGRNTYLFNLGSGQDTVYNTDYGAFATDTDSVVFGTGITPAGVQLTRVGTSLVVTVNGTGDQLTISYYFSGDGTEATNVANLRFADGTNWTTADVKQRLLTGTAGRDSLTGYASNDTLIGDAGNDSLEGGGGADVILGGDGRDSLDGNTGNDSLSGGNDADHLMGGDGNDTLDGGAGNDQLLGGNGANTYLFGIGSGEDTVHNNDYEAAGAAPDAVQFGAGVLTSNIGLTRSGTDLIVTVLGTGDRLTLSYYFAADGADATNVASLRFADGTTWSTADVKLRMLTGGAERDLLTGYASGDTLSGGAGQDDLDGAGGNDVLLGGDGRDVLDGDAGNDSLAGGSGADSLNGGEGNDTLDGGAGNDSLSGGNGANTYLFGIGSGHDVLNNTNYDAAGSNPDTVQLGAGITAGNLRLTRSSQDLVLTLAATGDQLTLSYYFSGDGADPANVANLRFADGTTWTTADIKLRMLAGTAEADKLAGYASGETLTGGDGNDTIDGASGDDAVLGGNGEDVIDGGAGNDSLTAGNDNDTLTGGEGNDTLDGGAGDDSLSGGGGANTYLFGIGSGDDTVNNTHYDPAGSNPDTLQLGAGITAANLQLTRVSNDLVATILGTGDRLTISSYFGGDGANSTNVASLRFADGTTWSAADVMLRTLTGTSERDSLTGYASNDTLTGGDGNDGLNGAAGADVLLGGDGRDTLEGAAGHDSLSGGNGADSLAGGDGDDTLEGGAGNDDLKGGGGANTYVFNLGSGRDTVDNTHYEAAGSNADTLLFGAGISQADTRFSQSGNDLIVEVKSSGDQVTVSGYFSGDGTASTNVANLKFANGTALNYAQVKAALVAPLVGSVLNGTSSSETVTGTAGPDTLNGGAGNDTLTGGAGNDRLAGGAGNDTYVFGRGSGHDVVYDGDATVGKVDIVQLGASIVPADVKLSRSGDTLAISIAGTGDKLEISSFFSADATTSYRIEQIRFADATVWDVATIKALALQGTNGPDSLSGYATADTIQGGAGDDTLAGAAGNDSLNGGEGEDSVSGGDGDDRLLGGGSSDTLYGNTGNDTLDGGAGNDRLYAGGGSDTFLFGRGSGVDVIYESDTTVGKTDVVQLGQNISAADVQLLRTSDNLLVTIRGTGDRLEILGFFTSDATGGYQIEQIRFADNTVWDLAAIKARTLASTSGDDRLEGYGTADTLQGAAGNDTLTGAAGNDLVEGGDGEDSISGDDGNDRLVGGASDDTLAGGTGDDTLDGGTGDDMLGGGAGNDTYLFGRGSGSDQIHDSDSGSGKLDVVQLGANIVPADIELLRTADNLFLRIRGTGDVLSVISFFTSDAVNSYRIEQIRFADGTTWDVDKIKSTAIASTTGDDALEGYSSADKIQGGAGADTLQGDAGNDTLEGGDGQDSVAGDEGSDSLSGGAGNDSMLGGRGDDTLDGGAGDDSLDGGAGSDTYLFGRGSGSDQIYGYDDVTGKLDVVQLGANVAPADVQLLRTGDTLVLKIRGTSDKLTIPAFFGNDAVNPYRIEEIRFADGTQWNLTRIKSLSILATAGDDQLAGYGTSDTLQGAAGNDTLRGAAGDDFLEGGDGEDELSGDEGHDSLLGGNSQDDLSGGAGNDTLDGGAGNDSLDGGAGNDTYLFGRGSGADRVYSPDYTVGKMDVVQLGANVLPADITLLRTGDTLYLRIQGTDDQLEVSSFFSSDAVNPYRIEQIRFADGTTWDVEAIKARSMYGTRGDDDLDGFTSADEIKGGAGEDSLSGRAGNDTLSGADGSDTLEGDEGNDALHGGDQNDHLLGGVGNDTLDGGAGDDSLDGGAGNDTYTFGRGRGSDTISSSDSTSGKVDVLNFAAGVLPADIQANRSGDHLVLWIKGTPDRIQVSNYFTAASYRVDQIRFADGTVWNFTTVQAAVAQNANYGAQVLTAMAGASDQIVFQQVGNSLRVQGVESKEGSTVQGWYGQGTPRVDQFTGPGGTALLAGAPGAGLLSTANRGADQTTRLFHDTLGRVVGQLDAENHLTENVYDGNGNLTRTIRYSQAVLVADGAPVRLAEIRPAFDAQAQVTSRVYDLKGRVVEQNDPEGTVTQYKYDDVGNLVSTSRAVGTAEVRQVNARYDLQGRLTGELSAEGVARLVDGQTQAQIDAIWAQHGLTHTYDAAGRRTSTTDANGYKTRFYYDTDGRLTHTVNALGEVEERRYDALNQLSTTLRLGTRLDASALPGLNGGLVDAALLAALSGKYNAAVDRTERYTYTTRGQVASTTDAGGLVVEQHYDAFGDAVGATTRIEAGATIEQVRTFDRRGLQTSSTTNAQATTRSTYDAFGRVVATVDANGALRQQNHDRTGRIIQTVDATGSVRQSTWDAFDRVLTQTDALGQVTRYAYSDTERSATVTTPEGVSMKTLRTRHGQTLQVTDARGNGPSYTYDRNGNLKSSSGPMGAATSSSYDAADRVIRTTDARGVVTTFTYDAANRVLTRQVDPATLKLTTTYEYDALGQQVKVTDPRGAQTTVAYDVAGRVLTQIVDPAGLRLETNYAYDLRGNTVRVTDPMRTVSVFTFDKLGRRTDELIDASGLKIARQFTYDLNGNVLTSTDPMGHVTRHAYDAENRLVYTVDAENGVTAFAYDASGRVTRTTRHVNTSGLSALPTPATASQIAASVIKTPGQDAVEARRYDKDGRVRFTVDGTGAVVEFKYDSVGNLIERTAYANVITLATWDGKTDPTPVADATRDQRVRMAYDAANRVSHVVDAMGAVTANLYTSGGDLTRQTQYTNTITATADPASVTPSTTDRVTRHQYDSAGRLAFTADPEGAVTGNQYDKNGNLSKQIRYSGTVLLTTPPGSVQPNNLADRANDYYYDTANRLLRTRDPEGFATRNVYDNAGRITSTIRYFNTTADPAAAPTADTRDQTTKFEYDAVGRLKSTTDALNVTERYTYNGRGDKVTFTNKKGSVWTYTYDAVGRLLTEKAPAVDITAVLTDARGDLYESTTQSVQLVTALTYDGLGNLLTRTEASGLPSARTTSYAYDAAGRQVRVTHPPVKVYSEAASAVAANGATGTATRVEETRVLTSQTFYDAFGNAVANIDVANNASFKVYDRANRVRYSIDAMGYVTGHTRDAFGDAIATTRFATALTGLPKLPTGATQAPTFAWTQTAVNALPHALDRTITTEYDRRGLVLVVREPLAFAYDSTTGTSTLAQKVTVNKYTAFGELVRSGVLQRGTEASGTWAYTYEYRNKRGLVEVSIDALGYRTTQKYDPHGNVQSVTEHATRQAVGTWDLDKAGTAVTNAKDRTTTFAYDRLNRKVLETRVGVEVSNATQAVAGTSAVVNTETRYGYDAVGNLTRTTDALGAATFSFYDALGRVTAVTAPARPGPAGAAITPMSLFRRDAYGNVVVKVDLSKGATGTVAEFTGVSTGAQLAPLVGSFSSADRTTVTQYDLHGHATQVTDAAGYSSFTSYNERGQVAKAWQGVTSGTPTLVDGKLVADSTSFKVFQYDALGQLTHTLDPGVATTLTTQAVPPGGTVSSGTSSGSSGSGSSGGNVSYGNPNAVLTPTTGTAVAAPPSVIDTSLKYNAFGEVVRKGVNAAIDKEQERFEYDNAGHLWQTNTGDGVYKVFLHDRQGNTTAELRSAGMAGGDVDLKAVQNAADANALPNLRRTETLYDALGHVTEQRGPARSAPQDGVSVQNQFSNATVVKSATPFTGSSSMGTMTSWSGTNQIDLSWPDLLRLGTGRVRVMVEYTTVSERVDPMKTDAQGQPYYDGAYTPVETRTRTVDYTADQAGDGVSMTWTDPGYVVRNGASTVYPAGGVDQVTRIVVSKQDSAGVWHVLSDGVPGASTESLEVAALADGGAAMTLVVRRAGSSDAWTSVPGTPVRYGDLLRYESSALPAGTYEYQLTSSLWYAWQGAPTTRTGTLTVGSASAPGTATSASSRPTVIQTSDRWGNVLTMSDPRFAGWTTSYSYNANNQLTSELKPDGAESRVYYDALGRQVATRDARNNVNAQAYDAGGNLVAELNADSGIVRHGYNAFGEKVTTLSAEGVRAGTPSTPFDDRTVRYSYDKMGRLVATDHGYIASVTINALMQISSTMSVVRDTSVYDQAGRKLSQTMGDGGNGTGDTVRYKYDLAGRVIETTQAGGDAFKLRSVYDVYGHKLADIDQNNVPAISSFDYFGVLLSRTDLGGARFTYNYDKAGQLTSTINSRYHASTTQFLYEYDTAGQVIKVTDRSLNQLTEYAYDLAGRHVRERTTQAGKVYQDNMLAYDNVGRLRHVGDGRMSIDIAYDKAGNRTQIRTHAKVPNLGAPGEKPIEMDHRFTYDVMNRQTGVDLDKNFELTAGGTGHILTYDLDGNRVSDTFYGNQIKEIPATPDMSYTDNFGEYHDIPAKPITYEVGTGNDDVIVERYAYDHLNRLTSVKRNALLRAGATVDLELDRRDYDTVGRVISTGPANLPTGFAAALNSGTAPGQTIGLEARTNRYDANGRLVRQNVYNSDHTTLNTVIQYTSYDAAGNVLTYAMTRPNEEYSNYFSYTHQRFDGYKENVISGSSSKFNPGHTFNSYDVNGYLTQVADTTEGANNRTFINDLAGHALLVNQGGNVQRQVIVNGEVLGRHGIGISEMSPRTDDGKPRFEQIADFDVGFQRITGNYPTASVGSYQVQSGDTLRSIARQSYGDEGLWYRIAETNGLTGDRDLRVGQTINIPSVVGSVHNNAGTFKPYDPSKVTGDTTPNLPTPAGDKGCGGLGMLLVIAVAVVVTVFTAGAAAVAMGGATGSFMAAGASVLAGGSSLTVGLVAGAVGAAAGSIASQGVAMALGMQEDFSWNQVGLAALGGGISAGIGAIGQGGYGAASTILQSPVTRAAVSNALTQGVSVAVGAQDKFSWRGVAAAAAGAYVSESLSDSVMGDPTRNAAGKVISRSGGLVGAMGGDALAKLGGASLLGFAAGLTAAAARGGKITVKQVATDAFGNALGDSLANAMTPPEPVQTPISPKERKEILDLFKDGPGGEAVRPTSNNAVAGGSNVEYGILSDKRVVVPRDDDQQVATPRNSNAFGIEPSDDRGFFPERANWNENNDEYEQALQRSMATQNRLTRQKNIASFEADAVRASELEGSEASIAIEAEKRRGAGGAVRGVNDFVTDTVQAPYHLARSIYDNGFFKTAEGAVEGALGTLPRLWNAVSVGDVQTATSEGLGLLLGGKGFGRARGASVVERATGTLDEVGDASRSTRLGIEGVGAGALEAAPNRIYSARELVRRVEEPGPFHNFPETLNADIYKGVRTQISGNYVLYSKEGTITLPGEPIYGRAQVKIGDGQRVREIVGYTESRVVEGTYEIGVRPSPSGRTEIITHRFFRPKGSQ